MSEVVVGSAGIVVGNVWDLTVAPIKPKTSGTIYVLLMCSGGANDGKFWDTDAGGSWQAYGSVVAWPTATYCGKGSMWYYSVPAAATTGAGAGNRVILAGLVDNLTAASQTTVNGGLSDLSVVTTARETLDGRIDAAITTRAPSSTAVTNATWTDARAAKLDHLTGDVMLAASYVAPDNADIALIKAKTDNLPADPADASDVSAEITASEMKIAILTNALSED